MHSILIVEDDRALSDGVCIALKSTDIELKQCYTLEQAQTICYEQKFDLIILDINLPDGNGLDFLKSFKRDYSTPIILLTANDMETDIVLGLEKGADDYITKPFSLAILRARVNARLRNLTLSEQIVIDNFLFDFNKMEFLKNKQPIELSKTEQKLLRVLIKNRGLTISRSDLIDKVWTGDSEYVDENALSVTIKRLRDKLEDISSKPKYIKTVYGIGYMWAVE